MTQRILLTGVFGPFGVDDEFGRKENIMELFHNQVTRAQGHASLRFHHRSFGLYFLAENVGQPVTVLDYPTREGFEKVLRTERFDAVGISFIVPNMVKAKEMARMVRAIQPHAQIILGGHGAAIEGVEKLIECDHVVKGEGIRWMRTWLGEDPSAPIRHPTLVAAEHKRVFGIPAPGRSGLLVPGVGCVNACRFCATSHFFGKAYTPFFTEGEALYRNAVRIASELPTNEFFVMDENFLKDGRRASELLACVERDVRPLEFLIFSSAETVEAFGADRMLRLGVQFVWMGAESRRHGAFEKNDGRDVGAIIRSLRDRGICVLVSGIVGMDHHTREEALQDIDWLIGLEGDLTQFMLFTPLPGTRLYRELVDQGLVDFDLPFEEWHGQKLSNWRHPHLSREELRELLDGAFKSEFDRNSASLLRMTDTALRAVKWLTPRFADPLLAKRLEVARGRAKELRLLFPTLAHYAHDRLERDRVGALRAEYEMVLGRQTRLEKAKGLGALAIARTQEVRARLFGDMAQPKTRLLRYRWDGVAEERPAEARIPAEATA